MTKQLKRYFISRFVYTNDLKITEHPRGDWVKASDHDAAIDELRAENESLRKESKQEISNAFEAGAEALEVAIMIGNMDFDVTESARIFAEKRCQAAKGE